MDIPVTPTDWAPCYRIIPSRFPPVGLFDKVADPADLEAVFLIEAMTNDRLRDAAGDLALVPPEDRVAGPGATPIMAAFTHLNTEGSRFTDGSLGVFYDGRTVETAIAETKHHRIRFLAATAEPAQEIDMRVYAADLSANLHDIRGHTDSHAPLYDPGSYAHSQPLATGLREAGPMASSTGASAMKAANAPPRSGRASSQTAGRNDISAMSGTARRSASSMRRKISKGEPTPGTIAPLPAFHQPVQTKEWQNVIASSDAIQGSSAAEM